LWQKIRNPQEKKSGVESVVFELEFSGKQMRQSPAVQIRSEAFERPATKAFE
jgi:hypothetical protein